MKNMAIGIVAGFMVWGAILTFLVLSTTQAIEGLITALV